MQFTKLMRAAALLFWSFSSASIVPVASIAVVTSMTIEQPVHAAAGDPLTATCTDGWSLTVKYAGTSAGGTFTSGIETTKNDPTFSSPRVIVTCISLGYDQSGAATTYVRNIFGNAQIRKAYPNATSMDEVVSGSDLIIRIALSDYIFDKDDNNGSPTVTFLAGSYTGSNAGVLTLDNSGNTLAYPRVIGNWSEPGYSKLGNNQTLRMVSFHGSGRSGAPVACVKFSSADAHSHTAQQTVTSCRIDRSFGDQVPVVEYIANLDSSVFTQDDVVTSNFISYPWIGDSASVLDTTDGSATAAPTPKYGPLKFIGDKNSTYCQAIAVVNTATGSDVTGAVSNVAATAKASPYATIGAAANAIRVSNIAGTYTTGGTSRSNKGGAIIYLDDNAGAAQNFAWTGATIVADGVAPSCHLIIDAYPGVTKANVSIASRAGTGTYSLGLLLKIQNVTLTAQSASGVIDINNTASQVIADRCTFNMPTASQPFFYRINTVHVLRCTITEWAQNMKELGTNNIAFGIVRGNAFNQSGTVLVGKPYTFIGNKRQSTTSSFQTIDFTTGQITPAADNLIVAFNSISTNNSVGTVMTIGASAKTHGVAFVQNLIEIVNNANPAILIAADNSSPIGPINNVLIWHNTIVGQRFNFGYNENGAAGGSTDRSLWVVKNNIWDNDNIKLDTFNGNSMTAMTRTFSAGTVTATCTYANHNYSNGDLFYCTGATPSAYNVQGATISNVTATTWDYTFANGSDPGAITVRPGTGPNPLRIAAWTQGYAVAWGGNLRNQVTGIGSPGSFMPNFAGIRTDCPTITQGSLSASATSRAATYPKFMTRASFDGSSTGSGGGDYRLQPSSPGRDLAKDFLIPVDLAGNPRSAVDDPGCYSNNRQLGF